MADEPNPTLSYDQLEAALETLRGRNVVCGVLAVPATPIPNVVVEPRWVAIVHGVMRGCQEDDTFRGRRRQ